MAEEVVIQAEETLKNSDLEIECGETLLLLNDESRSKITHEAVDLGQFILSGEGAKKAEVNKNTEVTLTARLSNKTTRCNMVVVSELKSLYDGSVIKCNVDQSGPQEYRIQYTPTVRGHHGLTVSVDGQQVAGSPFPVFVSISPTQLGKPVKVWSDIDYPSAITSNSENKIIIIAKDGDIVELDARKNKTQLIQSFLTEIESVATDDKDNIYCTDGTNTIMKCDKHGGNIQVFNIEEWEHHGIAVVGYEIVLYGHSIKIYDRQLQRKRHFPCRKQDITDISADMHGNLYVSDCHNNCIQVFHNNGISLHSFGIGSKRPDGPSSVCVSGRYLYCTSIFGDKVSVFTTEGEYITSFGQLGVEEGNLFNPSDVCVDKDGFVFVADYGNNRVQMF